MKLWFHWNVSRFHLQFSFSHPLWRLDFSFIYYWRIKEDLMRSIVVHARVFSLKNIIIERSELLGSPLHIHRPSTSHSTSTFSLSIFFMLFPTVDLFSLARRQLSNNIKRKAIGREEMLCRYGKTAHTEQHKSWILKNKKKIWAEKKKQKLQVFLSRFVFNFVSIVDHADFFS